MEPWLIEKIERERRNSEKFERLRLPLPQPPRKWEAPPTPSKPAQDTERGVWIFEI